MAAESTGTLYGYLNGTWAPLDQCQVPINTHALQYGTACFEGIRGYWDGKRINLLFVREHFQRLAGSARMLHMRSPTVEEMSAIAVETVRRSAFRQNCYLRPVVYKKGTSMGPQLSAVEDGFLCYGIPLGDYLDTSKGLKLCVSSWVRLADNMIPTRAKANGGYLNSALAKDEALRNGFDECLMLNDRGQLAEGSAENVFLVRDGVLITPDFTANILEGITRQAMLTLASEAGIPFQVRPVARTEVYRADEVFLVGTGCQVSWAQSLDHRLIGDGKRGPITARLQAAYENAVYGRDASKHAWLTPVA